MIRGNLKRFRGGLVFKAHRLFYHSTLGSRVKKKKRRRRGGNDPQDVAALGMLARLLMTRAMARIWS